MKLLRSPRHKLLVAGLLLAALPLLGTGSVSWVSTARWVLGAVAVAVLGIFLWRRRSGGATDVLPPRLSVKSRVGLSGRSALALVEADGRSYLVAYGDGFAEIREAGPAAPARRSFPRRRSASSFRLPQVGAQ